MISDSYMRGGISIVNLLREISCENYLERQTQVMIIMTKFEVRFLHERFKIDFDFNKFSEFTYPGLDYHMSFKISI